MLSLLTNLKIIKKFICYCICSTWNRLKKTTTTYNNIKCLDIINRKSIENAIRADFEALTEKAIKDFNKKLDIYNALDLVQRSYFKPGLIADLVSLILVRPKLKKYFGYVQKTRTFVRYDTIDVVTNLWWHKYYAGKEE